MACLGHVLSRLTRTAAIFTLLTVVWHEGIQAARPPDKLLPLPAPTGPYFIGTTVLHLVDRSRPDQISMRPGRFRELMIQLWYPARPGTSTSKAPYIPDPVLARAIAAVDGGYYGQSPDTIAFWKSLSTHAVRDAPPLGGKKFPLLLFSPGLGISRVNYTATAEQLASHGNVVALIDHPYEGLTVLPDGRVLSADDDPSNEDEKQMPAHLEQYVQDAKFALKQLAAPGASPLHFDQTIDFSKVGMVGHSLGGAAALQACLTDAQFKACADMDGAPFGKVLDQGAGKPTLLLLEDPDYSDADLAAKGRTRAQWEEMGKKGTAMWAAVAKNKDVPVYKIKIRGTGHLSFTDAPFVMPNTITRFGGHILAPRVAYEQITSYLLAFFEQYLEGKPSPLLAETGKMKNP